MKDKWCTLGTYDEYNDLNQSDSSVVQPPASTPIECFGALFTWQTAIGRCMDRVREWVGLGVSCNTLCDLLQGDSEYTAFFDAFTFWIEHMCVEQGYQYWSASMEVSPSGKDAVVNLHAYVCADWKAILRRDVKKGRADREIWKYNSFTPNVNPTTVKGNANVQKVLTQALFFCMVDKIGGVFRAANLVAGKDRS